MPSRVLVSDDGTFRTYNSLDDQGNVIGRAVEQYTFPPEVIAQQTQTAAVTQLLAGAQALLDRLTTYHTDLVAKATAQTNAKAALTVKIGNLPASPTVAQIGTFLKTDLASYLTATDASVMAVGTDLDKTITGLGSVVKALGNLIARQTGDPTVLT